MKTRRNALITLLLAGLIGCGWLFSASSLADDDHKGNGHFEREGQHQLPFLDEDNEGNETAGQIAAWLLVGANLTITMSILIRWANNYAPLGPKLKSWLNSFNRSQKKHLGFIHYYLNPAILGIVLWHWLTSRCKSSALPEMGLVMLVIIMGLGLALKFKLCPVNLRKKVYQIHTHPLFFLSMVLALVVGHTIVD
jgi:hypothetical protein